MGHFYIGALTGCDEVFVVSDEIIEEFDLEKSLLLPYAYRGEEVHRYGIVNPQARIIYPYWEQEEGKTSLIPESKLRSKYPNTYKYLSLHKEQLSQRRDSRKYYAKGTNWYCFLRPGRFKYITPAKLLIRGVAKESCVGILPKNNAFSGANCPGFVCRDEKKSEKYYLLSVLNSRLISEYLRQICPAKLQGYTRFNANNL